MELTLSTTLVVFKITMIAFFIFISDTHSPGEWKMEKICPLARAIRGKSHGYKILHSKKRPSNSIPVASSRKPCNCKWILNRTPACINVKIFYIKVNIINAIAVYIENTFVEYHSSDSKKFFVKSYHDPNMINM